MKFSDRTIALRPMGQAWTLARPDGFKTVSVAVGLLVLALAVPGPVLAQETAERGAAQRPMRISDDEVGSHRIGKLEPIVVHLVDGPTEARDRGSVLSITVVVGPDGSVISAVLSDEVNFDNAEVPKQWVAELKRVATQAEAAVRSLHYRPFKRNGHAVWATFEQGVPIIPPEMLPGPHVNFPQIHDWNSLRMSLERTGCLGTCPAYSVEVHGDGTVLYNGTAYVAVLGKHRGQISQQAVLDIFNDFRDSDYFSLRNSYRMGVTDNPTFTTSLEFDGRSKQVVDYVGLAIGMPAAVNKLENTIDELADAARWTKGNSATVPALAAENWNFKSGETADTLARMAMYGSADAVRDLIAAGVPLNGHDNMGDTPLQRAAFRGDMETLRSVLQAEPGADSTALCSALSQAAAAGKLEAVKLLLKYGASADAHPSSGEPPVVAAAASGVPAVLQEVLQGRPDISARGYERRTALIAAVDFLGTGEVEQRPNRTMVVRLLLAAGAQVDARDDKGNTALIKNAWDPDIAALLLQHGADINASNNDGWTPLFSASSPELARFLILHGANIYVRDKDGKTPVEAAKQYGNPEVVAVLEAAEAGKIK